MKILNILYVYIFTQINVIAAENVTIPDANFKAALVANKALDKNGDGEIQLSEAKNFKGELNLSRRDIADLTGIEAFEELTKLNCSNNKLSALSVSKNRKLSELNCSNNQLTRLEVSFNNALQKLFCSANLLTELDLSGNPALTILLCYNNKLKKINISKNHYLVELSCWANQLVVLDCSANPLLERLTCHSNHLESLDLRNTKPEKLSLDAKNNINLTCIEVNDLALAAKYWVKKDTLANLRLDCSASLFPNTPYNLGVSMPQKMVGDGVDAIYNEPQKKANFGNCDNENCTNSTVLEYINTNLKYPEQARKNKLEGYVTVTFVVEKDGSVSDAKILRPLGDGCDEEALRLVNALPKWQPAEDEIGMVRMRQNLSVAFRLEKDKKPVQVLPQSKHDDSSEGNSSQNPTKEKKKKKRKKRKQQVSE